MKANSNMMSKILGFGILLLSTSAFAMLDDKDCLTASNLLALDAQYEYSMLNDNYQFFEKNLHTNFVWIHNHATYVQNSRAELVDPMRKRIQENKPSYSSKRTQEDVQVLTANMTGVVHGYTTVERSSSPRDAMGNKIGDRYHFMRTYYKENDACYLLSNHTMLIPPVEK